MPKKRLHPRSRRRSSKPTFGSSRSEMFTCFLASFILALLGYYIVFRTFFRENDESDDGSNSKSYESYLGRLAPFDFEVTRKISSMQSDSDTSSIFDVSSQSSNAKISTLLLNIDVDSPTRAATTTSSGVSITGDENDLIDWREYISEESILNTIMLSYVDYIMDNNENENENNENDNNNNNNKKENPKIVNIFHIAYEAHQTNVSFALYNYYSSTGSGSESESESQEAGSADTTTGQDSVDSATTDDHDNLEETEILHDTENNDHHPHDPNDATSTINKQSNDNVDNRRRMIRKLLDDTGMNDDIEEGSEESDISDGNSEADEVSDAILLYAMERYTFVLDVICNFETIVDVKTIQLCLSVYVEMIIQTMDEQFTIYEINSFSKRMLMLYIHLFSNKRLPTINFFVHLPKTGGTSVVDTALKKWKSRAIHSWLPHKTPLAKALARKTRLHLHMGHWPYGTHLAFYNMNAKQWEKGMHTIVDQMAAKQAKYNKLNIVTTSRNGGDGGINTTQEIRDIIDMLIKEEATDLIDFENLYDFNYGTMLREPIERVKSHYYYHRKSKTDMNHAIAMHYHLKDWVKIFPIAIECYVQMISGLMQEAFYNYYALKKLYGDLPIIPKWDILALEKEFNPDKRRRLRETPEFLARQRRKHEDYHDRLQQNQNARREAGKRIQAQAASNSNSNSNSVSNSISNPDPVSIVPDKRRTGDKSRQSVRERLQSRQRLNRRSNTNYGSNSRSRSQSRSQSQSATKRKKSRSMNRRPTRRKAPPKVYKLVDESTANQVVKYVWENYLTNYIENNERYIYYLIARSNFLQFGWVGLTEHFDESMIHLHELWGIDMAKPQGRLRHKNTVNQNSKNYLHTNVNKDKSKIAAQEALDNETLAIVEYYNYYDTKLYKLSQILFLQQRMLIYIKDKVIINPIKLHEQIDQIKQKIEHLSNGDGDNNDNDNNRFGNIIDVPNYKDKHLDIINSIESQNSEKIKAQSKEDRLKHWRLEMRQLTQIIQTHNRFPMKLVRDPEKFFAQNVQQQNNIANINKPRSNRKRPNIRRSSSRKGRYRANP